MAIISITGPVKKKKNMFMYNFLSISIHYLCSSAKVFILKLFLFILLKKRNVLV